MAGTKEGGMKAAKTNKELYGEGFYARIGKRGGSNGHTGGFAANPALARIAGARGGRKSRRNGETARILIRNSNEIEELCKAGVPMSRIARKYGLEYSSVRSWIKKNLWWI